ncbi:tetratricopeptide repeat protein [Candidatus Sumerlaeota bacterium]|nr:tetratricopeptide repeat protein [Candidatus Sumerlaeota bacterium]
MDSLTRFTIVLTLIAHAALAQISRVEFDAQQRILVETLMTEAEDLAERGRIESARERWLEVVERLGKHPEAVEAQLRLAQTETDLFLALQRSESILTDHPQSPQAAHALALQGDIQFLLGDYESAGRIYDLYLRSFPQGEEINLALERLIISLIEVGRADDALRVWDRAAQVRPERVQDPDILMQRADAQIALGDHAAAAETLLDLIARFPNRGPITRAHLAAGLCLEAQSRWAEARDLYTALVHQWPSAPEADIARERLDAIERFARARDALDEPSKIR